MNTADWWLVAAAVESGHGVSRAEMLDDDGHLFYVTTQYLQWKREQQERANRRGR